MRVEGSAFAAISGGDRKDIAGHRITLRDGNRGIQSPIKPAPEPEVITQPKKRKPVPGSTSYALTKKQVDRIIELHKGGMAVGDAAKKVGVSRSAARKYLASEGVLRTSHVPTERMVELLVMGLTIKEVSAEVGMAAGSVRSRLVKAGIDYKALRSQSDEKNRGIVKMHLEGKSATEIGEAVGMHRQTVRERLRKMGYEPRKSERNDVSTERIMELHEKGQSVREIAHLVGMSPTGVAKRIREAK